MTKQFFDYDAVTGLAYYTEQDGENTILRSEQDCTPVLEDNLKRRNEGTGDNRISEHIIHYANIPNGVALELLKKGIDCFNIRGGRHGPEFKRFAQEIETNYPYLKVTNLKEWRPR